MFKYSKYSIVNNVGPASQTVAKHYSSIRPMHCVIWFLVPGWKASPAQQCISQKTCYNHPMLFQCRASVENCGSTLKQHWVNATGLCKVYIRPAIKPAMGCDAGPTLNCNLLGRPTSSVPGAGGGRNTRWIYSLTCLLGSFLNRQSSPEWTCVGHVYRPSA